MHRVCACILLAFIPLCNASSPPLPTPTPLDCNATDSEVKQVLNLINEARDEGFVFKPFRVVAAYQQEIPVGVSFFYLTVDVLETKCAVVSGQPWSNCIENENFHEIVFGQCKAIMYINKLLKTQKLLRYNCTISPVPSAEIQRLCPDCPVMAKEITPEDIALADQLVEIYNKENNYIRFFKTYHVERESSQWVFGPSVFLQFSIKETNCSKDQDNVKISNCDFLPDKDAEIGFCKGNTFRHPVKGEKSAVLCDLYKPRDHGDCVHKKENNTQKGHPDVPAQNVEFSEKQGADSEMVCRCHPHMHHTHSSRPHHHHHHHCHHHKPGKSHNHTSSEQQGSSSEEQTGKKHRNCWPKGSVEMIFLEENGVLPEPIIVPDKYHPTEFPDSNSTLETCPGKPIEVIPLILKYFPQVKERKH